ncbi:MAG TPA: hypothetical protein VGD55_03490 [Acidothermaceae bacterium]
MTNARRSAGLRRVSTATYGLVAASMTGVAVVTGVVAHQGVHHGTSPIAQTDDGSSTGTASASPSANTDDALGNVTPQSPAAQSPVAQSPAVQSPVQQQPAQQQPAQQGPVQVLPGGPTPVVGAVQKPVHHHAVTSGS